MTDRNPLYASKPVTELSPQPLKRIFFRPQSKVFRYIVIGGFNALIGYLAFCLLYLLLHQRLNYLVILLISNVIYMAMSFFTNKFIVFRSSQPWFRESVGFYLLFACCLAINYSLTYMGVSYLHLHPLIAQILATVASSLTGYAGNSLIIFKNI